jgi:hypothetical protein
MLEAETKVFEQRRDEWLGKGLNGWYVVIKGARILEPCRTIEEAFAVGTKEFGSEFLLEQVEPSSKKHIIRRGLAGRGCGDGSRGGDAARDQRPGWRLLPARHDPMLWEWRVPALPEPPPAAAASRALE